MSTENFIIFKIILKEERKMFKPFYLGTSHMLGADTYTP